MNFFHQKMRNWYLGNYKKGEKSLPGGAKNQPCEKQNVESKCAPYALKC